MPARRLLISSDLGLMHIWASLHWGRSSQPNSTISRLRLTAVLSSWHKFFSVRNEVCWPWERG